MGAAAELILYEHNESVCCVKVRLTLAEKLIAHRTINVALERQEQASPAFRAINPAGVVPVIVHHGRTITESSIITEYLDDAFPEHPLMPRDAYWRARRRLWARRIDDEMHIPHIALISFVIAFGKLMRQNMDTEEKVNAFLARLPTARRQEIMRNAFASDIHSERFQDSLRAYDGFIAEMELALAATPFLAGAAFSLADIDVIPYLWRLHNLRLDEFWARRPRVADWFARVTARPSFKAQVIDTALPDWVGLMQARGKEVRPVLAPMIAGFG